MPDDANDVDDDDLDRARRIEERRSSRGRGQSERSHTSQASNTPESSEESDASNTSQASETGDGADADEASQTSETPEIDETDNPTTVRDQTHVAMYLDEQLAEDLDLRFDELQVRYRRKHGKKMQKSRDFYPALARAAINDTRLVEELDLEGE